MPTKSLIQRILDNYIPIPEAGCWIWPSLGSKGYGRINVGKKKLRAHRASWEAFRGPIPPEKMVLHKCDTRSCVNPDHLYIGSLADNVRDALERDRFATGYMNPATKLTPDAVREIRYTLDTDTAFAKKFGVSRLTIRAARLGITWKHVTWKGN